MAVESSKYKYVKTILVANNIVIAKVSRHYLSEIREEWCYSSEVARRTFIKYFNGYKRAHKWADELIETCKKWEVLN